MFANRFLIANALILLFASLASATSTGNLTIFRLHATNSTVKGNYIKVHNKADNGSTEATAVFTKLFIHGDDFYVDQQGQLHLLFYYNDGPGGLYVGITDEDKDNPGDEGIGTLYFATDRGYSVHCPKVSGPVGKTVKFNCRLNSIYDGWTNAPFSWVHSYNKNEGVTDLVLSATSQALFYNSSIVELEAKIVRIMPAQG